MRLTIPPSPQQHLAAIVALLMLAPAAGLAADTRSGLDAELTHRFQPFPGYTSVWIELAGAAEALRYRDSELRDGTILSGSVSVGKYFTDRIRFGASRFDSKADRGSGKYDDAMFRIGYLYRFR